MEMLEIAVTVSAAVGMCFAIRQMISTITKRAASVREQEFSHGEFDGYNWGREAFSQDSRKGRDHMFGIIDWQLTYRDNEDNSAYEAGFVKGLEDYRDYLYGVPVDHWPEGGNRPAPEPTGTYQEGVMYARAIHDEHWLSKDLPEILDLIRSSENDPRLQGKSVKFLQGVDAVCRSLIKDAQADGKLVEASRLAVSPEKLTRTLADTAAARRARRRS